MYKNFGDKYFFDFGMMIEKDNNCYNVIYCMPYSDIEYNDDSNDIFQFGYLTVYPKDSWIDKKSVINYAGNDLNLNIESHMLYFVECCINYYGAQNFGYVYDLKRKEIERALDNLRKQGEIGNDVRF